MQEIHGLLILHLLGATIWVGGHLLLCVLILPQVWREKQMDQLLQFEKRYERIGMPALLVMVFTGIRMAYLYQVKLTSWLAFESPVERVISLKLLGLFVIVGLALSAQFYVLPRLRQDSRFLLLMTLHIVVVTLISIAMLVLGSFVRYGGIA